MTGLQTWLPLYIPHSWQENDVDDHRPKRDLLSLLHPLSMTRSTSRLFCRTRTFPASCPLRLCIHQVNTSISSLFVGISLVVSAPVNTTPCFVTMSCPKNTDSLNAFVWTPSKHRPHLDHGRPLSLFFHLLWLLCAPFEFSLATSRYPQSHCCYSCQP
jgi:hypothetical protein